MFWLWWNVVHEVLLDDFHTSAIKIKSNVSDDDILIIITDVTNSRWKLHYYCSFIYILNLNK